MKVAMLGWEFPPFIAGGLGVHCLELTRGLSHRGVDIDFYMPHMESEQGDKRVSEQHDHLRINEVEADPDVDPYGDEEEARNPNDRGYDEKFNEAVRLYNDRLVEAFDSYDADLLHCHDWVTVPGALELRERTGAPLVFTVHSTEKDRSGGLYRQSWIEDIEHAGVHGADRVITVSHYTQDVVQDEYDAPSDRIVPIHNGVNFEELYEAENRDYAKPRRTILFLSRLTPQKGPLQFLEAARRVLEKRPDARFVVAGKGPLLSDCIEFTLEHGMTRNVRFAGYVPEEKLAEVYKKSGIYVLPSISEPFGISILEAMATGLPTIVSKTTGAGEALDHVFKVDFWDTDEMADIMLGLLSSPALRKELGSNGGEEVHQFTWDECAEKTLGVYEGLTAKPPRLEVTA